MSMNDNNISPPVALPPNTKPAKKSGMGLLLSLVVIFLSVLGLAYVFGVPFLQSYSVQSSSASDTQALAAIEQRLTGLENSVRALDERVTKLAETPAASPAPVADNKASAQATQDIARLQSDVVALSAATTALQDSIKDSSRRASHAEETAQSHIAAAISLIELRETALSGHPYAAELASMRNNSLQVGDFQKNLNALEAMASLGAPTESALRDELISLETTATNAASQQQAQNWWDKILLKFRSLVSIRPVHGTLNDTFTALETSLAQGDTQRAQEAFSQLSPDVQQALSGWHKKLKDRATMVDALHNLAQALGRNAAPATTRVAP